MSMTLQILRDGQQRLADLLPQARILAGQYRSGEATSEVFKEISTEDAPYRAFLTEEHFMSLTISPGMKGGYSCDIVLKDLPLGISDVVGTAYHRPFETPFEALEGARILLASALASYDPTINTDPTFHLCDAGIPVSRELLDKIATTEFVQRLQVGCKIDRQRGAEYLFKFIEEEMKGCDLSHDSTYEQIQPVIASQSEAAQRLIGMIYAAVCCNITSWPNNMAFTPSAANQSEV